ncbi:flagellar protein FlgN [Mesobacillus foraminis]|uniref:FlgN protein n=1 Tax=Mesobacillus foraminis TaxID=279826 RepID=A0A4R2BI52_9BACI|nr:flagellar protein FlgN [Mesobacillus foraminis]TCN26741.1 FlgN protein [Mesobacillus foraminis]
MSTESLISNMNKLLVLHKSLLELSVKKTEIVKQGDMAALQQLIKDEQTHIAAIGRLEQERLSLCSDLLPGTPNPAVGEIAEQANTQEKPVLLKLRDELLEAVSEIKQVNSLNQELIHQSLQFINFSRSLVMPQKETYTYGPPAGKPKAAGPTSGLFNSKA